MILQEGTLQFDIDGAIEAFKFDEQDRALATYHGLSHCMKAVDFVVEYNDHYLFNLITWNNTFSNIQVSRVTGGAA